MIELILLAWINLIFPITGNKLFLIFYNNVQQGKTPCFFFILFALFCFLILKKKTFSDTFFNFYNLTT